MATNEQIPGASSTTPSWKVESAAIANLSKPALNLYLCINYSRFSGIKGIIFDIQV